MRSHENAKQSAESISREKKQNMERNLAVLKKENEELQGWVEIEGTTIDYPVMQADNEFYLTHDFRKKQNKHGVPFLDESINPQKENLVVYGHHMKDGTMFAALENYKKEEFLKEHKKIHWHTESGDEVYEIYCVCMADAVNQSDVFAKAVFQKEKIRRDWIEENSELLYYSERTEAAKEERQLVLITCEYTTKNNKLLVFAMKI